MAKRKRIIELKLSELQATAIHQLLNGALQPPKNPKAFFCGDGKWADAARKAFSKLEKELFGD